MDNGTHIRFLTNKDFRLNRTAFQAQVNAIIKDLNDRNFIVISYKMKENASHQVSGAYIRYKEK